VQPESAVGAIVVGSPPWYAWLADATSFTFLGERGTFTAHKERRGPAKEYWKAYRRRSGRLYRAYLGKSAELTLERLNTVAADLAGGVIGDVPSARAASPNITQDVIEAAEHTQKSDAEPVAPDDARSLHLLATKLVIPLSRPNLVPRPRLVDRLDAAIGQNQKLILISAPAGFGKTTAVVEWLSTVRLEARDLRLEDPAQASSLKPQVPHVAWLALDDHDNHLGQFLAYLIAALETVRPQIGAEAWALLRTRAAQPPTHAILTMLVNALVDPADRIVLVLDDYHTITLQAIHEAVAFLLDRMPAQMHVIMTSRADPPLPLARLRVRGALTEVRAADLRFTPDEAAYLFDRVHGVRLPSDAVAALEARTEGWVAGLQLSALSLQQQDAAQFPSFLAEFTGSHRYVFDYLADEVFQHQPDAVRSFLMQTAILGRICGPLCDAVTGQETGQPMLEYLDQANLFLIRLDGQRHWYRYHHLFQDFLCEHLERALEPTGRALLHRRASAWFEQNGLVGEAIDHALSAQAWEDAMRCVAPLMASQRFYEYFLEWPRWLAALPDAALQADPAVCLRLAWILVLTGHAEAAERPMGLAEAVWQTTGNQPKVGEILGLRALASYFTGDLPRAIMLARQALASLPADAIEQHGIATFILGFGDFALGHVGSAIEPLTAAHAALQDSSEPLFLLAAAFGLAAAYQFQGQLRRAATFHQEVIRRAGGATHQQQPAVYIFLGLVYYEWNDLAAAEEVLRAAVTVGQRTGRGRYWPSAHNALAQVLWAQGDTAQATALVEQALAAAQLLDSRRDIAEAEARQAWLWLAQADLAAAARWLSTRALNTDNEVPYERQAEALMLVRIRMAQERQTPGSVDLGAVVGLLDRLCKAAEADERLSDRIAILALTALARAVQGDPNQALVALAEALALAEPEGYIRTFVDEGAPMRALITDCRLRLAQPAQNPASESGDRLLRYIDRLLAAFPQDVAAVPTEFAISQLLSERERSVLQLLAAGRSVPEIATLLVISAHTARTHVKNIYTKLDAHNRVQALERARELHLL